MAKKDKKKLKAHRRESFFKSRPIFCKIDVEDGGTRIFKFRGRLDDGWRQFKQMCVDKYQIDPDLSIDLGIQIDGLKSLKLPVFGDNDERKNE